MTAWEVTSVYDAIVTRQLLPDQFYIVGDEAFVANEQVLTPWGGAQLSSSRDAFNYLLSSQRQCIERSFGMLTQRFGVLWRPLRVAFKRWSLVLTTCAKLHNLMVEYGVPIPKPSELDMSAEDTCEVFLNSDANGNNWPGRRRWDEQSVRRDQFTEVLNQSGIHRPKR